jgi:mono/diheme cytochrome c family protein
MDRTGSRLPESSYPASIGGRQGGGAGLGLLLWLFALALFVWPFLRERDGLGSEQGDFGRNAEVDIPFEQDLREYEAQLGPGLAAAIRAASEEWFAPGSEKLEASGVLDLHLLPTGQAVYEQHCVGCHGASGDGAGPAARYLAPRPRNFRKGMFKFTSTESGARPQRRDLFQSITRGLAGSSMPSFRLLPEEKRWALVEYVRYLSMKGELEQVLLDDAWENEELPDAAEYAEIVLERWHPDTLRTLHPGAPEPARDQASVERGRALFTDPAKGSCFTCHGTGGRGDGPTAGDYQDDWGYPIRPRDLTAGVFRAGAAGEDLYRTIATGIKGTPMGSFQDALTPLEIWDLVHFVQSLPAGSR